MPTERQGLSKPSPKTSAATIKPTRSSATEDEADHRLVPQEPRRTDPGRRRRNRRLFTPPDTAHRSPRAKRSARSMAPATTSSSYQSTPTSPSSRPTSQTKPAISSTASWRAASAPSWQQPPGRPSHRSLTSCAIGEIDTEPYQHAEHLHSDRLDEVACSVNAATVGGPANPKDIHLMSRPAWTHRWHSPSPAISHDGAYVNLGIGQPTLVIELPPPRQRSRPPHRKRHARHGTRGPRRQDRPRSDQRRQNSRDRTAGQHPISTTPILRDDARRSPRHRVLGAFRSPSVATWPTGTPEPQGAIPAVGGAMDLAVGAKQILVIMNLLTRDGQSKIAPGASPAHRRECVTRIYTDLAVFLVKTPGSRSAIPSASPSTNSSRPHPCRPYRRPTRRRVEPRCHPMRLRLEPAAVHRLRKATHEH